MTPRRNRFYLDLASVERRGQYREVWSAIEAAGDPVSPWRVARNRWIYDCGARTGALKAFVQYGADGRELLAHEVAASEMEWEEVAPGSVGELQWKAVCG